MNDDASTKLVYIDSTPSTARNPALTEDRKAIILSKCEEQVEQVVARMAKLPDIMIYQSFGEYIPLLLEAREIYSWGHFYSCVAMCGITAERMVKDILRGSIMVRSSPSEAVTPTSTAFDQFERVEVSGLARFLIETEVIEESAWQPLKKLIDLRNAYAHARGKAADIDALRAIEYLHAFVDLTTSVMARKA